MDGYHHKTVGKRSPISLNPLIKLTLLEGQFIWKTPAEKLMLDDLSPNEIVPNVTSVFVLD